MAGSLYWHDYETFGIDPQRDRPAQFAGVRTDFELNIISDPLVVYCKLAPDYLPQPEACLITGITPQTVQEKGLCEAEFIAGIHQQMAMPGTCTVGYNNIRFDDEVTRNLLYRNFYDPYAREWKSGNSRWDIIDLARAARSLRPEGVVWPVNDEGNPSFRLDKITVANDIEHGAAHDALADVMATIAVAKLIKSAQPKLYQFIFSNRGKNQALKLLQEGLAVVHISGRYPAAKGSMAIVLPVCKHPTNNNGVMVYDLSIDPEPMLSLSAEQIQQRIFTASADLPDGVERIPLKNVHINKCPVLAPVSVLRKQDLDRLELDIEQCHRYLQCIVEAKGLSEKLADVFSRPYEQSSEDPDLMIYSGGFFNDSDRAEMNQIKTLSAEKLAHNDSNFYDPRLPEMLFRYRARNYPETLNEQEQQRWLEYRRDYFNRLGENGQSMRAEYQQKLALLQQDANVNQQIIANLITYADEITSVC
jgi:exodeoxyribonuclease-1